MKRSAKIVLTLVVPAMTAFGCGPSSHSSSDRSGYSQSGTNCNSPEGCSADSSGGTYSGYGARPRSALSKGFGRIGSFFSGGS